MSIASQNHRPPKRIVYLSHHPADAWVIEELSPYLATLARDRSMRFWARSGLAPGQNALASAQAMLRDAAAAVVLVSQDYLADRGLFRGELTTLLQRRRAGRLRLIPLFVAPSLIAETPLPPGRPHCARLGVYLTAIEGICRPERPLAKLGPVERKVQYVELCRRLTLPDTPAHRPVPTAHRRPLSGHPRPAHDGSPSRSYR